mgnify:CR=1 FL=1
MPSTVVVWSFGVALACQPDPLQDPGGQLNRKFLQQKWIQDPLGTVVSSNWSRRIAATASEDPII